MKDKNEKSVQKETKECTKLQIKNKFTLFSIKANLLLSLKKSKYDVIHERIAKLKGIWNPGY